jgi:phage terminase large subunit-like protein
MINEHVTKYIQMHKDKQIILNKARVQLIELLESEIFPRIESGELHFDNEMIENCIQFIEKWYFPLKEFQKFLISFIFLFDAQNRAYYNEFLIMMGRGGGKNGFITGVSHFLISELHGIREYNGSLVANSENQAMVSFEEMYNSIVDSDLLSKAFRTTKKRIDSKGTRSKYEYHTSSAKTKDGLRDGFVIFDEIHEYENAELVNTFRSGLGKRPQPRTFYIGTDGYLRDGFIDTMKKTAKNILEGEVPQSRLFPFICKLDDEKEVFDTDLWQKANPQFEAPVSDYGMNLFITVKSDFDKFEYDSTSRAEFMTKRMNMPEEDLEKIVATWEDIQAASRPMPLLKDRAAIVGVDYASVRDFAAVGFLFRVDNDYVWHTHSFARREFLDKVSLGPPIDEWADKGYLTIIDAPTIPPEALSDWVEKEAKKYNIKVKKVMVDRFRYDITRPAFQDAGFEIESLNYMPSIHAQLAPRVETIFSNRQVVWGDNPLMRWYTNNTAVKIKKDGNKEYIKKDPVRRKTDGFHAFLHALYRTDEVLGQDIGESMDFLDKLLG